MKLKKKNRNPRYPWTLIAKQMKLKGHISRNGKQCSSRWIEYLSVDRSKMNKDEEKLIVKEYAKKLTFRKICNKLHKRCYSWVKLEYMKLLRKNTLTIQKHLYQDIETREIYKNVKEGLVTFENFKLIDKKNHQILQESLKFVTNDREGFKVRNRHSKWASN